MPSKPVTLLTLLAIFICWSPPAQSKDNLMKAWVVNQQNNWRKYTVYITNDAIRAKGLTGGSLLARAPNWHVAVYNEIDKAARVLPPAKYMLECSSGPTIKPTATPKKKNILGLNCLEYEFPVNADVDATFGSRFMFKGKIDKEKFLKSNVYTFAEPQGKYIMQSLIWSAFISIPKTKMFPIGLHSIYKDGTTQTNLKTLSQKNQLVSEKLFLLPEGLSRSDKPIRAIFGGLKRLDDTVEYFFPEAQKK